MRCWQKIHKVKQKEMQCVSDLRKNITSLPPHKQDYLKNLHLLVYSRNQAAHALELNGVFKSFLALLKQMFKMYNNSFN